MCIPIARQRFGKCISATMDISIAGQQRDKHALATVEEAVLSVGPCRVYIREPF
jgi:hypothetical protein